MTGGTKVTVPGACFEDDTGKVLGKLKNCGGGCGTDLGRVYSLADGFVDALLGSCKI